MRRAEQGSALADQAGLQMSEIVEAIKRVTDLMSDISHVTTEQSTGVLHVSHTVSQMDQTTQQNAALVETSAAAADETEIPGPAVGRCDQGVQASPQYG